MKNKRMSHPVVVFTSVFSLLFPDVGYLWARCSGGTYDATCAEFRRNNSTATTILGNAIIEANSDYTRLTNKAYETYQTARNKAIKDYDAAVLQCTGITFLFVFKAKPRKGIML